MGLSENTGTPKFTAWHISPAYAGILCQQLLQAREQRILHHQAAGIIFVAESHCNVDIILI